MSALTQLLPLFPQLARRAVPATRETNVLLFPAGPIGPVVNTTITRTGPAQVADDLPLRVVAVLGPGATFRGLAGVLLGHFNGAAGIPAGTTPLTVEELAKALADFAEGALGPSDAHHRVGLLVPLPIHVDGTGKWTVDVRALRARARAHTRTGILGAAPKPLPVPTPAEVEGEARALFVPPYEPGFPFDRWDQALRNPAELVLVFYELVRLRARSSPRSVASFTLLFLQRAKPHHLALLAAMTPGNAILRLVRGVLSGPVPAGVDATDFAATKAKVEDAVLQGPAGNRTLVPHQDVPLSVDERDDPGGRARPTLGEASDPPGGLHRLVLGRDIATGRDPQAPKKPTGITSFAGPVGFEGRLELDPYLETDATRLGSDDPLIGGPLELLSQEDPDHRGRRLDTAVAHHSQVLAVGIEHWSATDPQGLPALLSTFKSLAPAEFDLFFRIHGLDVESPSPGTFRFVQVAPNGTSTPITGAALATFFGRSGPPHGPLVMEPTWVARFRLAALVSNGYRRAQVQLARARVTARAKRIELAVASAGPFPKAYVLDLDPSGRSPAMRRQLMDRVVGDPPVPGTPIDVGPVLSELPTGTASRETLAGFVIDITGNPARPAFADVCGDDTFYVGSMGKVAALYAALELRTRLRLAVAAAGLADFDFRRRNWHKDFIPLVTRLWSSRVGRGFRPADLPTFTAKLDATMPRRLPRLEKIFRFSTIDASPGGQVDFTDQFDALLLAMIQASDTHAASQVVDRLDFPYINSALRQAGFYDPRSNRGIWVSGNYVGGKGDWVEDEDLAPLTPRGAKHYKADTNFMGNARQFARLFALAATGKLFGDPDVSREMVEYMRKEGRTGTRTPCFIREAVVRTPPGIGARPPVPPPNPDITVSKYADKIGIGKKAPAPSPYKDLEGMCDGAIIERPHPPEAASPTMLRYVLVFVGGFKRAVPDIEGDVFYQFVQELDGVVAANH